MATGFLTTSTTIDSEISGSSVGQWTSSGYNGTGALTAATANKLAAWDSNKNLTTNSIITAYQSIVTSGATTTLVVGSPQQTIFTGSSTQTLVMPVTSTLVLGQDYFVTNNSSGSLTVNSSGGNFIFLVLTGASIELTCISISLTTAAAWNFLISPSTPGLGSSGQVWTSNGSGVAPTFQAAGTPSPLTTKGDIYTFSTVNDRLPIGTINQVLIADSSASTGNKWGTAQVAGGGTGRTTLTANAVLVGNGTTQITLVGTSATQGVALVSQGSGADPAFATVVVAGGGTGQTTLTAHDVLIGNGTSAVTLVSPSTSGLVLMSNGTSADPSFQALSTATFTAPTVQRFTSSPTGTTNYSFTITAGNTASVGAIYTNNGFNFTLLAAMLVGDTIIFTSGTGSPLASGTLTYSSGTHTGGNITYSVFSGAYITPTSPRSPLYIKVTISGGGGGGGGSGSAAQAPGISGSSSLFGTATCTGGIGGGVTTAFYPGGGGTVSVSLGTVITSVSGGYGGAVAISAVLGPGGSGGTNPLGGNGGGSSGTATELNGFPGSINTGAGGGGTGGGTAQAAAPGGGAGGYLQTFIFSPSAIYNYTVGGGGAGGTGTTNAATGGAGGSGIIIVEEYYQ